MANNQLGLGGKALCKSAGCLDLVAQLWHSHTTMRKIKQSKKHIGNVTLAAEAGSYSLTGSAALISISKPFFIHGDACAVAGVDSMDLNNWIQRGVIHFGTMIVGRRVYSIIDLVKLCVIGHLARTLTLKPTYGAAIAESVLPRATEIAALDKNGELIHRHHSDSYSQYLIAWVEPEKAMLGFVTTGVALQGWTAQWFAGRRMHYHLR